ncbi:MAG: glucosaminidase domain-containing protein [Crocinitomicaceae bacterium]|nr:glucosaminidase domain-containing protein [Crocinitomicaceae bacterium]
MKLFSVIFIAVISSSISWATGKYTVEQYIETWSETAVNQMVEHGIPASVTLAQGILESSYGNSYLARNGNNHFGIKCHDWTGPTIHKDDDTKNECFRKYKDAKDSYTDHSLFLTTRSRYAELFTLDKIDYSAWAKGLKKAGYATNPKYDKLIIELIEKHQLMQFDQQGLLIEPAPVNIKIDPDYIADNSDKRKILVNANRTKYIIAQEGDTYYRIASEFGLTIRQLHRYNDFPKSKTTLSTGDFIYLMPKANKSKATAKIKVEEEKSLWIVSQEYGIKLKSLMDRNNITSADALLASGDVIILR